MKKLLILIAVMFLFGCSNKPELEARTEMDKLILVLEKVPLEMWENDNALVYCVFYSQNDKVCIHEDAMSISFSGQVHYLHLNDEQRSRIIELYRLVDKAKKPKQAGV